MRANPESLLIGAVAYHPRVVTVWETFRGYFEDRGLEVDYILYSNYERLVEALLTGAVDLAWNTNTAFVLAENRLGGKARILGMRDVDAEFATVLVAPAGTLREPRELEGRVLALGSRDSGHAAILPLHYLSAEDVAVDQVRLLRFDTDLGKHGDTGDSELRVVRAVSLGQAAAGAIAAASWARFRTERLPEASGLEIVWRRPLYYHCCFTALSTLDAGLAKHWLELLLAMDYNDPALRHAMDLEGVKRWLEGDKAGYGGLTAAMREQGYLD